MDIYVVEQITEADFGCEETDRSEPVALLKLRSVSNESVEKYTEVSEAILSDQGISEGKKVCFTENGSILKYVRVVAAVMRDGDKIFATARGYGEYKGWWEFPGGKIEEGESPQEALVREIREELTAVIKVDDLIQSVEYDYPKFHLSMDCFWAGIESGSLVLKEAESAKWLSRDELDSVNWLPADQMLVDRLIDIWK